MLSDFALPAPTPDSDPSPLMPLHRKQPSGEPSTAGAPHDVRHLVLFGKHSFRALPSVSSRPEEFHLRALPEPCMTISSHTAPDVQPLHLERLCLVHGLPVSSWPMAKAEQRNPFAPAPFQ